MSINKRDIKIDGMKELSSALEKLKTSAKRRIIRGAVTSGARVIRKSARDKAKRSKRTGSLWRSIDMKVKTNAKSGNSVAIIGPRKDYVIVDPVHGKVVPNRYSHLVEYGTSHSAAQPFLRPAVHESKGQVGHVMGARAKELLAAEAAKAASRKR